MDARLLSPSRLGYRSTSLLLAAAALACLAVADLSITALNPWAEFRRLLQGLISIDLIAIEARAIVLTVAFAVIGVGIGASAGLGLALLFPHSRLVRLACAFLRSIHELFWPPRDRAAAAARWVHR